MLEIVSLSARLGRAAAIPVYRYIMKSRKNCEALRAWFALAFSEQRPNLVQLYLRVALGAAAEGSLEI